MNIATATPQELRDYVSRNLRTPCGLCMGRGIDYLAEDRLAGMPAPTCVDCYGSGWLYSLLEKCRDSAYNSGIRGWCQGNVPVANCSHCKGTGLVPRDWHLEVLELVLRSGDYFEAHEAVAKVFCFLQVADAEALLEAATLAVAKALEAQEEKQP